MSIKYFDIIDENIKSKILEYLTYKNINSIKTLNKNFSIFLKKYQNYKLKYEINKTFITNDIKKFINNKLYSQGYFLENIFDKPKNIFINISKFYRNLIEVYLINEDLEYELILTKDVDVLNRIEYLYYGGEIYIFFQEKFIKYNLLKKKWSYHKIINEFNYIYTKYEILNNKIYIVQSFWDPHSNYTSCPLAILDEYNIINKLDISTKYIVPRRFHAIAQFEGKLWIAGGINDNNYLSSVEVFDEDRNKWIFCNNMNKARVNFKLFVYDNNLYAVGGDNCEIRNDIQISNSTKSPENFFDNESINSFRSCIDEDLLKLGEKQQIIFLNSVTTIEKFDNIEKKWNIITQLNIDSTYFNISLVNNYIIIYNKNILSNEIFINNLLEEYYKETSYNASYNASYIFDIKKCKWIDNANLKKYLHFL
jgi:hypothetical protein